MIPRFWPTQEFRGGHLLGELPLDTRYSTLVALFGEPGNGDEYKVSTEWTIDFEDGHFVRIYDWKVSELYEPGAYPVHEIRSDTGNAHGEHNWHVGGEDPIVVARVIDLVEAYQQEHAA